MLRDARNTFWTRTLWESEEALRLFMLTGVHRRVMSRLLEWCDEASVVQWSQKTLELPSWAEAHQRMQRGGRASMVNHPSPYHRSYTIPFPVIRPSQELRIK